MSRSRCVQCLQTGRQRTEKAGAGMAHRYGELIRMDTEQTGPNVASPKRPTYRCNFCGKSQEQVRKLIAGPGGVYICDECVRLCQEILDAEERTAHLRDTQAPPTQ